MSALGVKKAMIRICLPDRPHIKTAQGLILGPFLTWVQRQGSDHRVVGALHVFFDLVEVQYLQIDAPTLYTMV